MTRVAPSSHRTRWLFEKPQVDEMPPAERAAYANGFENGRRAALQEVAKACLAECGADSPASLMSDTQAGWEVEGFINRLMRRTADNDERLVLEAIAHLRAFSNQDTVLRERIVRQDAENERLRAVLENLADPDK